MGRAVTPVSKGKRTVPDAQKPLFDSKVVDLHLVRSSKNYHVYGASSKEIIANDIYLHRDVVGEKAPDTVTIQVLFPVV